MIRNLLRVCLLVGVVVSSLACAAKRPVLYPNARLQEVGIHSDPFEPAALQLLIQAGRGLPRLLNHLAQRALEEAALDDSRVITSAHVQRALELMPWVAQLAP